MTQSQPLSVSCIIPARYASQRLPAKPLADIGGLPLVMWAYRQAEASSAFDHVAVATDDQRIYDVVNAHGGRAIMTAPTHASGTDRVREAAGVLNSDLIVNLQGDEPVIPPALLKNFVTALRALEQSSLLTCVTNATIEEMADPNVVKAVLDDKDRALYFSRSAIPFSGRSDIKIGQRHIGIYGFTRPALERFCDLAQGYLEKIEKLEQLRALEAGMTIRCMRCDYRGIGIDTPQELEILRAQVVRGEISVPR